ncbi:MULTISPECIES: hypothetical protein [Flavobacterium]|uniref:Uncharacterized protein n=1 Tax=Flavobacterium jumunjinense TaxID=998845 RepID=A0ABV5GK44_9FLAO|nr:MULTISPECIES: hypothetical protein [Flavobacterium]
MTKFLNILLLFTCSLIYAHKNVMFQKSYGNVNLISSTPYYTEDINKNIITAKYVELLLNELGHKDSINLYLWPNRELKFKAYFGSEESQQKILNIWIPEFETNISKTLSLVETIITNQKSLDKKRNKLLTWYNSDPSEIVKTIHLNKMYRPNDVPEIEYPSSFDYSFDYFYENGIYHILTHQNRSVTEVAQVDKILQFEIPIYNLLFIFTDINSLTIIKADYKYDGTEYKTISETMKFDFQSEWEHGFRPYEIRSLGRKYITIETIFSDKIFLYNISKKKLILDLYAKLEE